MPTGSPWKALDLTIQLELAGPKASVQSQQTVTFERALAEEPPFATLDDTRLQAGMTHITDWQGEIPTSSPSGPWELVVKLQERSKVSGQVSDVVEQRIALIVD